jgi:hypothetical protein
VLQRIMVKKVGGKCDAAGKVMFVIVCAEHIHFVLNVLFHFIGGTNPPAVRVLELQAYYPDAEEWGRSPPASQGVLNAASLSFPDRPPLDQADAAYKIAYILYFCRILGVHRYHPQRLIELVNNRQYLEPRAHFQ